jgi:YfiH family protein
MRVTQNGSIKYFRFKIFPDDEIIQAVFTRQGGVSPSPWDSLNQGGTTGDIRERVVENRRLAFYSLGLEVDTIFDVWQVHGSRIVSSDIPRDLDELHEKADGIITATKGVTLFMRFADCVPILLYEPETKVIAIVHAGWQGTVNRIAGSAVEKMVQEHGCKKHNILVGIGPSIGPDHYAVRDDVITRVKEAFPQTWRKLLATSTGVTTLDLWQANKVCLEEAGVEQIEIAGMCTACNLNDWYSHRAEGATTGRFGVLLALR